MATRAPWCPVAATDEVIAGWWKPTIPLQLRAMEQDGIVARTVHNSVPPHVEYSCTRKGLTLGPILDAMEAWGEVNRPRRRRP